jgi:hypothetical protein
MAKATYYCLLKAACPRQVVGGLFKIFAKIVNKLQKQIDVNRFSLIN